MHEISLCQSMLRIMEEQAAKQRFTKVSAVYLEVGVLAGVDPEALRFGFDVVMQDSLASGAELEIIMLQGRAWCEQCLTKVNIQQRFDACPECGGHQLKISAGEELRIKDLAVM